jgi:DNA-binding NarL/FixJ family response regulator
VVEAWGRRNHPYPAAYARLRLAEALFARRTRNAEAAAVLRAAYRTARDLGARPLAEEIQLLATRARVDLERQIPVRAVPGPAPARAVRGDLSVLTARELQVLEGVAAGETNKEIGGRLFISARTVGVHISHILAKLQVRSRVQATALFERNRRRQLD